MTTRPVSSSFSPLFAALLVLAAADRATAQLVHFPDATLANPPQVAFPFYTPGAGSTGQTVRLQVFCPDWFLAAQNLTPGLVTRVQFSLAGQAVYDTFVLRAGTTNMISLTTDWTTNLPDQRVQRDLSNQLLVGGGTAPAPANAWVEVDLDHPFYWQLGQGIVVDLTTHIAVPGVHCGTTTANTGGIQRAYNFGYTPGAPATNVNSGGIAVGFLFTTTDLVSFGSGCSSPGGTTPSLSSLGQATLGGAMTVVADNTLLGSVGGFLWGLSRRELPGGQLPLDFGGGCSLLVSPDLFLAAPIGPGTGTAGTASCTLSVPNDPLLLGAVAYTQFAQFDAATPALVPLTFSGGGIVVIH